MNVTCWSAAGVAFGLLVAGSAAAADLPLTHVKAIGNTSTLIVSYHDEKPFWEKTIPEASGGRITAEFAPLDQLGIQDQQMLRLTKMGVFDFAGTDISKMAGDNPVFEGGDLAGLALDVATAKAVAMAWKPAMARVMEEKFDRSEERRVGKECV